MSLAWRALLIEDDVCAQATDLPGSGSVKRLAAASGLTMYADDPGAPFPRLEVLFGLLTASPSLVLGA